MALVKRPQAKVGWLDRVSFLTYQIRQKIDLTDHISVFELSKNGEKFVGIKTTYAGNIQYNWLSEGEARLFADALSTIVESDG